MRAEKGTQRLNRDCDQGGAFGRDCPAVRWRAANLPLGRRNAMRLPRFSIASVLAVIAIVALAALRSPSYLWANAAFTFVLGALVVVIVNVFYGRQAGRADWLVCSLCDGV